MKIVYFQLKANRRWLFSWTSSLTAEIEVEIMNENRFAVIHGSTEDYIDDLDSKNTGNEYSRSNAHGVLCRRCDTRRIVYHFS